MINAINNTSQFLGQKPFVNSNKSLDTSKSTTQILGYGVDKDGFFTSEFNEKAGIPKDYKINAKKVQDFVNSVSLKTSIKDAFFVSIDPLQTLSNAYKLYSNLSQNNQELPQFFEYNFKNFEITKIYQSEAEFMDTPRDENSKYDFKINVKLEFKEKPNLSNKGDFFTLIYTGYG